MPVTVGVGGRHEGMRRWELTEQVQGMERWVSAVVISK